MVNVNSQWSIVIRHSGLSGPNGVVFTSSHIPHSSSRNIHYSTT